MPVAKSATSSNTWPCSECRGRYSLGYDDAQNPIIYHTLPYCSAFEAVVSVDDAIRYSERCRSKGAKS